LEQKEQWKIVNAINLINYINKAPYRDERLDTACEEALKEVHRSIKIKMNNE